jgi:hypothetical protein
VNGNVQCISVTRAVLLNQGSKEHCHSVMFILQVPEISGSFVLCLV